MTARRLETRLHPDDRIDPGKTGPQAMRPVTVNAAESPIAWLASRGMLTPAQPGAGARLRVAHERAGLSARGTTRWDAATPGTRPGAQKSSVEERRGCGGVVR